MESNELLFLDPPSIIKQIKISPESVVADFGCGSGYFSIPVAEVLSNNGKIYSMDVMPQALESVTSKAKMKGLTNVIPKRVNVEKLNGSKLESESLDWVIIKDMLFQNKGKDIVLKEAYRVLRSSGKALIIEWGETRAAIGPEMDIRVSKKDLLSLIEKAGFRVENEVDAGEYHYGFVVLK